MAMGAPPEPLAPINKEPVIIAPPPPGADTLPPVADMPSSAPSTLYPQDTAAPQPAPAYNGPVPSANDYPVNNVTGVLPKDDERLLNKKFCTIKVSFGSECCGTDVKTGEAVQSYLESNPDILSYTRSVWGKEGEYDLCIDVPEHRNRGKIYANLKRLIPKPNVVTKGVTTLSGQGFAPVSSKK